MRTEQAQASATAAGASKPSPEASTWQQHLVGQREEIRQAGERNAPPWTDHLDAEPGPGHIQLQLATTEHNTDMYVELTPDQALAVSAALLKFADVGTFDFDLD